MIGEDRGALFALAGLVQEFRQAVAIKDVVAEHQSRTVAFDERRADNIGLRETVRTRLLGIGERAPTASLRRADA